VKTNVVSTTVFPSRREAWSTFVKNKIIVIIEERDQSPENECA